MLRIKMLNSKTPIANEDGSVSTPKKGDVIDVANGVGTSLIRGGDGEQVDHDFDKVAKAAAKKLEEEAAEKLAEEEAAAKLAAETKGKGNKGGKSK